MSDDPNTNIVHVVEIEGLASQIGEHLSQLNEENPDQRHVKYEALEYLANYEVNQLCELRKNFE